MSRSVLVAGIGNVLCSDDGFGSEVARRLANERLPAEVTVVDFGTRTVHFALSLLEPFDLVVVIDVVQKNGTPGTLYLIEPDLDDDTAHTSHDAHGMDIGAALALARSHGARPVRLLMVGCEPFDISEGLGLSAPIHDALPAAVGMVRDVLRRELCTSEVRM